MENLGFKGSLGVQLTCLHSLVEQKIKIQQPWLYEKYFVFKEPYFVAKAVSLETTLQTPIRPTLAHSLKLPEGTELTKETMLSINQRLSEIGVTPRSCAVHIKVHPNNGLQSKYSEACLLLDKIDKMDYVVFGKDRLWCEKFLGLEEEGKIIQPYRFTDPSPNDLIDLFTISLFPYQIIDTSSAFGLWAAAMNTSKKKQIFLNQESIVLR